MEGERARRLAVAVAYAGALSCASGGALAAQSARLVYSRSAASAACPDEAGIRQAVARRLGYDPFVVASPRTLVAELFADGGVLKGRVYLIESDGLAGGTREFASTLQDCSELAPAVALAISIAIDPDAADYPEIIGDSRLSDAPDRTAQAPASEPASPGVEPESRDPESLDRSPAVNAPADRGAPSIGRERPSGVRWSLGAGGFVASGPVPSPAVGVVAFGAVRGARWGASLEPRWLPASSASAAAAASNLTARVSAPGVTAAPCYRSGAWFGCYVFDGALLVSEGRGVLRPRTDRSLWFAQGPRLAHRWESEGDLSVILRVDGLWAAQRVTMRVDDSNVFETPRWLVRLGLDLEYQL